MSQSNTKSFMYWKQAENGLIAHVYEHVASSFLTDYLANKGIYFIADFDHWARTYGTILYLDFNTHTSKSTRTLQKAFITFKKSTLSSHQILRAVQQIAIEYERPLMEFEEAFIQALQTLHAKPWVTMDKLPALQASEATSVNTVFSMPGIRYGRKTPKSFTHSLLHFEVDKNTYDNNPAMKALAVLVVQAVALNLHRALENAYVYYDGGDEWDRGATTVAYQTDLFFIRGAQPTVKELQEAAEAYVHDLITSPLARKLKQLLHVIYKDERSRYFSLESMNEITGGIIIGYAGWKSVSGQSAIQHLLEHITVKVIEQS